MEYLQNMKKYKRLKVMILLVKLEGINFISKLLNLRQLTLPNRLLQSRYKRSLSKLYLHSSGMHECIQDLSHRIPHMVFLYYKIH